MSRTRRISGPAVFPAACRPPPDGRAVFSPDSRTLFSASRRGLLAWDTGSWTPRWSLKQAGTSGIPAIPAISGDGRTLAVARLTHGMDLFYPASGALLATVDHPDPRTIGWLALDSTGSRLVVKGSLGNIQLWDLRRLREELRAPGLDWPAPPLSPLLPSAEQPAKSVTVLPPVDGFCEGCRRYKDRHCPEAWPGGAARRIVKGVGIRAEL